MMRVNDYSLCNSQMAETRKKLFSYPHEHTTFTGSSYFQTDVLDFWA